MAHCHGQAVNQINLLIRSFHLIGQLYVVYKQLFDILFYKNVSDVEHHHLMLNQLINVNMFEILM